MVTMEKFSKTNGSGTLSFGTLAHGDLTGTLALSALEIDGGTDIGADLADADLLIVDDGVGEQIEKLLLLELRNIFTLQYLVEQP